jgi:hypothetical protein
MCLFAKRGDAAQQACRPTRRLRPTASTPLTTHPPRALAGHTRDAPTNRPNIPPPRPRPPASGLSEVFTGTPRRHRSRRSAEPHQRPASPRLAPVHAVGEQRSRHLRDGTARVAGWRGVALAVAAEHVSRETLQPRPRSPQPESASATPVSDRTAEPGFVYRPRPQKFAPGPDLHDRTARPGNRRLPEHRPARRPGRVTRRVAGLQGNPGASPQARSDSSLAAST